MVTAAQSRLGCRILLRYRRSFVRRGRWGEALLGQQYFAGGPSNTGSQSWADCHIGLEASQCGLRIPSYFRYQWVPILLVYKGQEFDFEPSLDRGES
jgi:hypothetical protein